MTKSKYTFEKDGAERFLEGIIGRFRVDELGRILCDRADSGELDAEQVHAAQLAVEQPAENWIVVLSPDQYSDLQTDPIFIDQTDALVELIYALATLHKVSQLGEDDWGGIKTKLTARASDIEYLINAIRTGGHRVLDGTVLGRPGITFSVDRIMAALKVYKTNGWVVVLCGVDQQALLHPAPGATPVPYADKILEGMYAWAKERTACIVPDEEFEVIVKEVTAREEELGASVRMAVKQICDALAKAGRKTGVDGVSWQQVEHLLTKDSTGLKLLEALFGELAGRHDVFSQDGVVLRAAMVHLYAGATSEEAARLLDRHSDSQRLGMGDLFSRMTAMGIPGMDLPRSLFGGASMGRSGLMDTLMESIDRSLQEGHCGCGCEEGHPGRFGD